MVTVGTFRVKGSMSQDVSVSEESPKKEKKKKKGLRTPSFLKKKKEKKKSVEAKVLGCVLKQVRFRVRDCSIALRISRAIASCICSLCIIRQKHIASSSLFLGQ
uniref:Uncharacterized protein n=1 Tax=Vespula pensylvanica TaxID=30213 RepID=A0A834JYW1_VESPE|nr:hypothetical protein H0235_016519 [Vespula pensylvanica]